MFKPKLGAISLLAVLAAIGIIGGAAATTHSESDLRVAVQRLDDGRIEVAVQVRQTDGSWGERELPEHRFVPADAPIGRWLTSSAVQTAGPNCGSSTRGEVRIAVRPLNGGRIEIAVQARQSDGSWGERQLPQRRFAPADASANQWLTSSAVQVPIAARETEPDEQLEQEQEVADQYDDYDYDDAMDGDAMEGDAMMGEMGGYPQSGGGPPGGGGGGRFVGSTAPRPAPRDTTFRDYERSELVRTTEDDTATFALDVDRTSYRLALNWARERFTVEPDSVRAEEWINAFDYRYEPPSGDRFFAVTTDVAPHPFNGDCRIVRVGIQAPEPPDNTPLNVTLVLDASGSMAEGDRVAIARAAAESIRSSLTVSDRIAVVQFTTGVVNELTVEPTQPGDSNVGRSIEQLRARGATNVQAGLNLGVQLADQMRRARPGAYNYVILMSDGVANVDATDPFAILEQAGDRQDGNPLRLIAVGVGIANYNDYLLEQLAQHGNGWYRYLSTPAEAQEVFSPENWLALSRPFADQTRAQVVWDSDAVSAWRMIGYENRVTSDESFDEDRQEFAEIPAGTATTVFFELKPTAAGRRGAIELGSVELRWLTPAEREPRSQLAGIVGGDRPPPAGAAALLDFGMVVALTADRYGALTSVYDAGAADTRGELERLSARLNSLQGSLGELDSYSDFRFLLERLIAGLPEPVTRSGYSR